MDENYAWKRTEIIEIDLTDLLCSLFMQWKRIAVCAAVFALVLGGYGWLKSTAVPNEGVIEIEMALTEAEEQAVSDAAELEDEIRGLEIYLENSLLMQIDPYHKNKFVMLYCIDNAKMQELPGITESYLNFAGNGGVAGAIKYSGSSWKTDKSYLAEVILAYQKTYNSPYQFILDGQEDNRKMTEALFYVEAVGRNEDEAEKLAEDIKEILDRYSTDVKKLAGSHRLRLVSTQKSVVVDNGLQSQQRDKKALLSSNRNNLKVMTDNFNEKQMALYRNIVNANEQDIQRETEETERNEITLAGSISGKFYGFIIKYIILGAGIGVFIYSCVFLCRYIFRDTVKSTKELKTLYTFPVYGEIELENKNGKQYCTKPGKKQDVYGSTQVQMMNRLRLACKKNGIKKLIAASDFPFDTKEKECLERIIEELKGWEIDMEAAECVSTDTGLWDELEKTKNVLMICRIGTTTHQMIDDSMNFYLENRIAVMGAAVFLHNK